MRSTVLLSLLSVLLCVSAARAGEPKRVKILLKDGRTVEGLLVGGIRGTVTVIARS